MRSTGHLIVGADRITPEVGAKARWLAISLCDSRGLLGSAIAIGGRGALLDRDLGADRRRCIPGSGRDLDARQDGDEERREARASKDRDHRRPSRRAAPFAAHRAATAARVRGAVACLRTVIRLDGSRGEHGKRAQVDLDDLEAIMRKTSGITLAQYLENHNRFDEAFARMKDGDYARAIDGFNSVLAVEPKHVQSHGNLGLCYAAFGDTEKALQHLDRAIELDPTYLPAIGNRKNVEALRPGERLDLTISKDIAFYSERFEAEKRLRLLEARGMDAA
jgi:tetratricopeptide (TPR) repeat protein